MTGPDIFGLGFRWRPRSLPGFTGKVLYTIEPQVREHLFAASMGTVTGFFVRRANGCIR